VETPPPPYEIELGPQLKPFLGRVSVFNLFLTAVIGGLLVDRLADTALHWTGFVGRASAVGILLSVLWWVYRSKIVHLALDETSFQFACAVEDVRYALADIESVTLWVFPRNGQMTIGVKTRTRPLRRRFRAHMRNLRVLDVERDLLAACHARGIKARTATIFVLRP